MSAKTNATTNTRKLRAKRLRLISLMVLLILAAAGLFVVIGLQAKKVADDELGKFNPTATPSPAPDPNRHAFAGLEKTTLNPNQIETFVDGIPEPHGLGIKDGFLYASSWKDKAIYKIDLGNRHRRLLADELDGAHDMVFDGDALITPIYHQNRVVRVDTKSGRVSQLAGGLAGPNGITRARDGSYYVSNAKSGTIVKIKADGSNGRQITSGLKEPAGLVTDNDNILRAAQYANPQDSVSQVFDNGKQSPVVTGLTNAESLVYDERKYLLIGYLKDGRGAIFMYGPDGTTRQVLQTGLPGPFVGPVTDGKFLYFESAGGSTVYRIALP